MLDLNVKRLEEMAINHLSQSYIDF
jgi:hypothetical protein